MNNSIADLEVGGGVQTFPLNFEPTIKTQNLKEKKSVKVDNTTERDVLELLISRKTQLDREIKRKPNANLTKRKTLTKRIGSFFTKTFS